jgi:hypothetical protein
MSARLGQHTAKVKRRRDINIGFPANNLAQLFSI